ncbi:MAG TPA: alpha-L-fucosidase [Phycisphaerae bacterium]|jgi:alpha-L-fucosidase
MNKRFVALALFLAGAARAAGAQTVVATQPASYWPAPLTAEPELKSSPPKGPFEPTWASIRENYKMPQWFRDAKFGIFIHWGLYSVPAYHNEWYERHMYSNRAIADYHEKTYGPADQFGYKDFIPLFKAEKFNADEWAALFKASGAKFVVPCAEHHDGYAMWDSDITPWCAGKLGPKKDFIGMLSVSIKKAGLVFGVSSHRMEHWGFDFPEPGFKTDVWDPRFVDFYGKPVKSTTFWTGPGATQEFQEDWFRRLAELVDKYHPQMVWFDSGVNAREYDPIKLKFAAYYFNRAHERGEDVTISSKGGFQAGSVRDFEKVGSRSPTGLQDGDWQIDDPIGSTWGYATDEKFSNAGAVFTKLIDTVSKGGNYLLNLSPNGDGVIVEPQPTILKEIGAWLAINGEAIYATHAWTQFSDGGSSPIRFTIKDKNLYAMQSGWPRGTTITIAALTMAKKVTAVELLGSKETIKFTQDDKGLTITLPAHKPHDLGPAFRIVGVLN